MAARKKKQGQTYAKRTANGARPLSLYVSAKTSKEIDVLQERWGFGYVRDVIAEAVRLAATGRA